MADFNLDLNNCNIHINTMFDIHDNQNVTNVYHVAAPANHTAPAKKENRKAKKSDAKPVEKQHRVDYPVFTRGSGVTDKHLEYVRTWLILRGCISPQTSEEMFMMLFSGESNNCEIKWTGKIRRGNNEPTKLGKAALYALFKRLNDEQLIKTSNKAKIGPILENHFTDEKRCFLTNMSNVNRTSGSANELIEQVIKIMRTQPTNKEMQELLAEEMQVNMT